MAYAYSWYLKSLGTLTNWDFGAVPANPATGVAATALQDDMIGALKSTGHAREAAQVIYAIASHPNLIRVWIAVPAQTSLQAGWVDAMQGRYPGVHWDTLLAGLEHATSPGQCCQTIP
jgi:ABC-type glycerol-3-phosphate transport system substrate-binding protein